MKNLTNNPVDVLAVMDGIAAGYLPSSAGRVRIDEARAAVAEVKQALAAGCGDGGLSEKACAALLARLGGGAK